MKGTLATIGLMLVTASQCVAQGHTFTEFDAPNSVYTTPMSINSSGEIAGYYTDSAGINHGFLRDASGIITTFDMPGAAAESGTGTLPNSLNDSGEIVGYYYPSSGVGEDEIEGFIRDASGSFTVVHIAGYTATEVLSINNAGQITGCTALTYYCYDYGSTGTYGFLTNLSGRDLIFSPSGADTVTPWAINNSGSVTGFYSGTAAMHGFIRTPGGVITEFDPPDTFFGNGAGTFPFAINDSGLVTGNYWNINYQIRGFVRTPAGVITGFDAPGATPDTYPMSVNEAGEIVGRYIVPEAIQAKYGAFIREPSGTISAFEAPGAVTPYGTVASSINAAGQIAGYYYDAAGLVHGFLRN